MELRRISLAQVRDAIQVARNSGNVVSKMGKYGVPQMVFSANGIRVILEEHERSESKLITAFPV